MRKVNFLAWIMSLLITISLLPATVFAEELITLDGVLALGGTLTEGCELSADFKLVTPSDLSEDSVTYLWQRKTAEDEQQEEAYKSGEVTELPQLTQLGTDKTYTLTSEDVGSKIVLTITGDESQGYTGSLKVVSASVEASVSEDLSETEEPETTDPETEEPESVNTEIEEPETVDSETEEPTSAETDAEEVPETIEDDTDIDSDDDTVSYADVITGPGPVVNGTFLNTVSANPTSPELTGIKEGQEISSEGTVTLTNGGIDSVTVSVESTAETHYFNAVLNGAGDDGSIVLGQDESATVTLTPVEGLKAQTDPYTETFTVYVTDQNSHTFDNLTFTASITVSAADPEPDPEPEPETVHKLTVDPTSLDFGTSTSDYTETEFQSITIYNEGDFEEIITIPESDAFTYPDAETGSTLSIAAGEKAVISIQPKTGLSVNTYNETLSFGNADAHADVDAAFTVVKTEPVHKLTVDNMSLDFGTSTSDYTETEAQSITIYNEGNVEETISMPKSSAFTFDTTGSTLTIAAGDSASISIQPKTGLSVNTYKETLSFGNADASVSVSAAFKVVEPEVKTVHNLTIDKTSLDFGSTTSDYSKTTAQSVVITNKGNVAETISMPASSVFTFDISEGSLTIGAGSSATVSILPKTGLGVNGYKETLTFGNNDISVSVAAAFTVVSPTSTPAPKTASANNNQITGITYNGTYSTASSITFKAVGAGMDNASPSSGDTRYIPSSWKVLSETSFSDAAYTGTFGISEAGNYTLTVTFREQKYDGSTWVNTGNYDTKQVPFTIVKAAATVTNPGLNITPAVNQKSAVRTGDSTPIAPFVILLIVALAAVGGVVYYRRKK